MKTLEIAIAIVTLILYSKGAAGFSGVSSITFRRSSPMAAAASDLTCPSPTPVENVVVLKDADSVGQRIREIVAEEAEKAIESRGHFALAIPGGSILKMLAGDIPNKEKWTSKTTLFYVNHKCVDMEDGNLATHAKARKLFLDEWEGVNALVLSGSSDGEQEATSYEEQMKALSDEALPKTGDGLPLFDLSLIGVGGEFSIN